MKARRKPELVEAIQWQPGMVLERDSHIYCSHHPSSLGMRLDSWMSQELRRYEGQRAAVNIDDVRVEWALVAPGDWVTTDRQCHHRHYTDIEFREQFDIVES